MTEKQSDILILWDSNDEPPNRVGNYYRWNGYVENGSVHSLLRYVENHDERLRGKYLAWIHDLGETRIDNRRLIEHFELEDDFSFWWMTLFVEKNPWKTPAIIDAIRLFAFEEIIKQQKPKKIRLVSQNQNLHKVMSRLCLKLGITYYWERQHVAFLSKLKPIAIYRSLPNSIRALIYLARHVYTRWSFRKAKESAWLTDNKALFFCSYFSQISPENIEEGVYHSQYWGGLNNFLRENRFCENWLQIYYPNDSIPDPQVALDLLGRLNRSSDKASFHSILDTYLSFGVIFYVLKNWLKLSILNLRLHGIEHGFNPRDSDLSLWPIMRKDWLASTYGVVATSNLLWIKLFDRALSDLPQQTKGFYLCENQSWERAFIYAWRKHHHGQLVAVIHSTVRFWDIRYYNDVRTVLSQDLYSIPQPDLTALNGKMAIDAYSSVGYPKEKMVECEAVRYEFLNNIGLKPQGRKMSDSLVKILILGDYLPSSTDKMLKMLDSIVSRIPFHANFTLKPHPHHMVNARDYPSLNLKVVVEPLHMMMADYDLAFSSNMTSAGVDTYLADLSTIVFLDETMPIVSPLRGQPGVSFVSTTEELFKALQNTAHDTTTRAGKDNFFFLDPELPRWRHLLSSGAIR